MHSGKIAVIGDKDLILAFKAIGMDVFSADTESEAEKLVKQLAKEYAIIFITEDLAEKIDQVLAKYKTKAYPVIIPIPSSFIQIDELVFPIPTFSNETVTSLFFKNHSTNTH